MFGIGVYCNGLIYDNRRAKLPVEMELEETTALDVTENDDDSVDVARRMEQMMKFKKRMFQDAKDSIDQAQSCYKKDYDRKRSSSKVMCTIPNYLQIF